LEVQYRWHPYFGCKVVIRRIVQRATGRFLSIMGPAAAQRAGIEHAKAKEGAAYLGRKPSYSHRQFVMVKQMLAQNAVGIARIAQETGLTRQTIYRI
jgi:hypothetical protein